MIVDLSIAVVITIACRTYSVMALHDENKLIISSNVTTGGATPLIEATSNSVISIVCKYSYPLCVY